MNLEKQEILNKIIKNITQKNIYKQGYILVCDDDTNLNLYSLLLAKSLICPNEFKENCSFCNICRRIDDNTYTEVKIIKSVNGVIKKDDIIKLKKEFQNEPIEGKNLVYIIENAENLNISSANSILKFLEEPDANMVGIFTTKNYDRIIKTISSRCEVIKLSSNNNKNISNLEAEDIKKIIEYVIKFESNFPLSVATLRECILDKFGNKESIKEVLNIFLLSYKDMFNYKIKGNLEIFKDDVELKKIAERLEIDDIIKKINVILDNIDKANYNLNITLFMINLLNEIGDVKCKK